MTMLINESGSETTVEGAEIVVGSLVLLAIFLILWGKVLAVEE